MKTLPECGIDMHVFLAIKKLERKKQKEIEHRELNKYLDDLLADIAGVFKVDLDILKSGDRQELTVLVRQFFYFIARTKKNCKYKLLTDKMRRVDHSSAIHLIKKTRAQFYVKDPDFIDLWNHYLDNSKLYNQKDFE